MGQIGKLQIVSLQGEQGYKNDEAHGSELSKSQTNNPANNVYKIKRSQITGINGKLEGGSSSQHRQRGGSRGPLDTSSSKQILEDASAGPSTSNSALKFKKQFSRVSTGATNNSSTNK